MVSEHGCSRSTGNAKRVTPAPPPLPPAQRQPSLRRGSSNVNAGSARPAEPRDDQVTTINTGPRRQDCQKFLLFWVCESAVTLTHWNNVTTNALMSLQVCPSCLTNAKDLAFGCGHMVRTDSESLVHNNAMQQPTYRVSEKTCLLMFSFSFGFFCKQQCCRECGESLTRCPICRQPIRSKLRLYSGWIICYAKSYIT